jgi:AcrR family transcriptional regulator
VSRRTLTRDRVLSAALALADKDGIDALTMRNLGQKLGVEAMSLYNHVANKEEILDGLVDQVFGEIQFSCAHGNWKAAMRQRATSMLAALSRHRWAIGLMESRTSPLPTTLRHHESVLECLRQAGFSVEMAAHAYSALDSYIYGFALNQQSLPFDTGEQAAQLTGDILAQMQGPDFPRLAEIAREYVMKPGYSYAKEFGFGLDLVLDSLERQQAAQAAQRRSPQRRRTITGRSGGMNSRR